MAKLDEKQIQDSLQALERCDTALAELIVAGDNRLDALQRDIEEKVVATIAKRQPVAIDLRRIVGALRICNDLERVGDLAASVAKRVLLLNGLLPPNPVMLQLRHMGELALGQLTEVMASYEENDVTAALEVWQKDKEIDALHNSLFRELLTYMMENPRNIGFSTHVLFCAKNIERMGDHTTNIAETVYYIVKGVPLAEERPKAKISN